MARSVRARLVGLGRQALEAVACTGRDRLAGRLRGDGLHLRLDQAHAAAAGHQQHQGDHSEQVFHGVTLDGDDLHAGQGGSAELFFVKGLVAVFTGHPVAWRPLKS